MGLFDAFKKDPYTLYLSLSELPQPRGAAIFTISFGATVIATSHLTIDSKGMDTACRVVTYHSAAIKQCGYQKAVFKNFPDWAEARLQATLDAL